MKEVKELSRSKILTLNNESGCGYNIKYNPHAFTESGLYMLMTVLRGELATAQSKALIRIFKGMKDYATLPDHVHMYVSIQPKMSVSKVVGRIKGKNSLMLFDRHPEYRDRYNRHFWARGYYCETIGNVDEATITKYIEGSMRGIDWKENPRNKKGEPLLSGYQ